MPAKSQGRGGSMIGEEKDKLMLQQTLRLMNGGLTLRRAMLWRVTSSLCDTGNSLKSLNVSRASILLITPSSAPVRLRSSM